MCCYCSPIYNYFICYSGLVLGYWFTIVSRVQLLFPMFRYRGFSSCVFPVPIVGFQGAGGRILKIYSVFASFYLRDVGYVFKGHWSLGPVVSYYFVFYAYSFILY